MYYNVELKNLSSSQVLGITEDILSSQYFRQQGRFKLELTADKGHNNTRLDTNGDRFGSLDLSSIVRGLRREKTKIVGLRIELCASEKTMSDLGFESEENRPEGFELLDMVDLRVMINTSYKSKKYRFQAVDLGLKRSYYEENGELNLFRKDNASLRKWYSQIDAELNRIAKKRKIPFRTGIKQ